MLINMKGLNFLDTILWMRNGFKAKLSGWGGYWTIEKDDGGEEIITVHLKDGGIVKQPHVKNMLKTEWRIIEDKTLTPPYRV